MQRYPSAIHRVRLATWAMSVVMLVVLGTMGRNGPASGIAVSATAATAPPLVPDPQQTPGATLEVTKDEVCVPGYAKKIRNVPTAVKQQVYAAYGIESYAPGEYEVDYLISLELGGSNAVTNLWPQSFQTQPWNAHVKDQLENELHRLVCAGQLDLNTAQRDIAADWIAAYKTYFHTETPVSRARSHKRRAASRPPTARSVAQ